MTTPLLPTDTLWERAGVAQKSHSRATHPASCIYICISGNYCLIIAKPLPKHALSLTRARAANPHTATTPLCARQMNETSETATCLFASTSCVSVARPRSSCSWWPPSCGNEKGQVHAQGPHRCSLLQVARHPNGSCFSSYCNLCRRGCGD